MNLRDLYQEMILDHGRKPRNLRAIAGAHDAEGFNPLCGDQARVYVALEGDRIADVAFTGQGCSISTASASMMTEALKGKTRAEAEQMFARFHALLTTSPGDGPAPAPDLGKLAVFSGVSEFPLRVKCATLAWHTLKAALGGGGTVSTE